MVLDLIIIIVAAGYIRKRILQSPTQHQAWRYYSRLAIWISIGLLAVQTFFPHTPYIEWIPKLALIGLIYLIATREEFRPARVLVTALLPYVIVTAIALLVEQVSPAFYKDWKLIWDPAEVFAVLWGFGVWIVTARQRKELAKSRRQILEQEERNRLMAEMKAELEKQVKERTLEITNQKNELEVTLAELKVTQAQLIHSEKMASLGELTAGIAHEIQNPLNFVNNFSEVNMELIEELKEELTRGKYDEALDIADNIKDNETKIAHHGRRADGIVKGMLQHSRASAGEKEPVDLNALCDEYMRLAYHGLRAKDKTFNADMDTDFDPALTPDREGNGKVRLLGQEIGRVILNLLTNAFYAVHKLNRDLKETNGAAETYSPWVEISTKKFDGLVEVTVTDNGGGIPAANLEKIFQPFFTTKPTGEGTGLGLSLSYEIIAKGHHGHLNVITKNGEGIFQTIDGSVQRISKEQEPEFMKPLVSGTRFIISIPLN